jgi:hypothetical protein
LIFSFLTNGSTDIDEHRKITGYSKQLISGVFQNLHKSEIIKDGVYQTETGMDDPEHFTVEFWLHVLAAVGYVERFQPLV